MVRGSMAVAAAQVLLGLPGAPDGFITFNPRMLSRLLNAPSSDNCTCDLTESLQEFSHKLMKGDRNSKGGALEMTGWMPECRMQTIPECFPNAECKHSPNAFPDALSRMHPEWYKALRALGANNANLLRRQLSMAPRLRRAMRFWSLRVAGPPRLRRSSTLRA